MTLGTNGGWHQLLQVVTRPDNIPVLLMVVAVFVFTWLSLRSAVHQERFLREGRAKELRGQHD